MRGTMLQLEYHRGMDIAIAAPDEWEESDKSWKREFFFIDFLYMVDQVKVSSESENE